VNGKAAPARPEAPATVLGNGGAGPGSGKQVPSAPPGAAAAVADGGAAHQQAPGRPDADAAVAKGAGPNQHSPASKTVGASSEPQGDRSVAKISPKPQVKKNKPDPDSPAETAQSM
jgi:hypothetical protein